MMPPALGREQPYTGRQHPVKSGPWKKHWLLMTIADEFRRSLEVGLTELSTNEWAITEAREQVVSGVTQSEAFENIVDVLSLAGEQTDRYAFASCCWLVLDLAKLSDTTELPRNLEGVVVLIAPVASKLQVESELQKVANWYRVNR